MPEVKLTASYDGASLDKGLNNLKKVLVETSKAAQKLDSTLAKQVPKGANTGAAALTDFNRVIQDAPFGIVGISNNITQLSESFGRLKASTGSTGGAVKALLGSRTGAGGLGFAISLITSIATFASVGFGAWTRGLQANAEQVKKTKDAYDEIIKSLSQELVKVELIVAAIKNENLTRKQRVEAINQLQAISPAYFGTLNAEKATVEQISAAYDKFSQSILRNISAKIKEKDLLEITEKILKLQEKGRSTGLETVVINGRLVKVQKAQMANQDDLNSGLNAYQAYMKGVIGLTVKEQDELANLLITQKKLIDQIASARGADPFIKLDKPLKVKKADVEIEALDKVNFGKQAIERIPPQELTQTLPIPVIPRIEVLAVNQKEYEKSLRAALINEGLFEIFADLKNTVFRGLSDAFTQGLSGLDANSIFGNFFKSIFTTLGTALQELGLQTLAAGKLIMSVKKLLGTSAGLGASIGLIALGGIVKALANSIKTPAFALGGIAPGGGILVGERGPEIITPPRGSRITPNAQTNAILGNGGWNGSVEFEIDGMKLRGLLQRADSRASRFGQ